MYICRCAHIHIGVGNLVSCLLVPANSTFCTCKYRQFPANSAFEAPKAELAAELTDTLENITYLFEINAAFMA